MLDQITASTRVGSEWIGKARAFRSEVKAVDTATDRALDVICKPLRERLKRKPTLRRETLPEIARRYDQLAPAQFRIGKVEGARHKGELRDDRARLTVVATR